ncbi:hypothetical protein AB0C88_39565 [Streptomyces chartreusis]|uniref:hypothetical protein n=1 Tax=Streptomyces chartreusis TaxID=1969 RepID=UPI00340B7049
MSLLPVARRAPSGLQFGMRRCPSNPVVAVGVEVDDAGYLDDVVLYRQAPPHTYVQVKYAADSSTPVNEDYLLKPSDRGGPSILRYGQGLLVFVVQCPMLVARSLSWLPNRVWLIGR